MIFKKKTANKNNDTNRIVVVSGLPRSGTSLMMQMLEAGGIEPLTDHEREADDDNPKGYYEFERVKKTPEGDTAWLQEAQGKAVKIITAILVTLPADHSYDVIFMRREMEEILASQKQMLLRRGEDADKVSDEVMAEGFRQHIVGVFDWMGKQKYLRYIEVSFNALVSEPGDEIARLSEFLGRELNPEEMRKMISPDLYRQRGGKTG
jgi:hypothetical protein